MDGEIAKLEDTFITRTNNHYRTCSVNFHLEYIQTIKTAKTLTVSLVQMYLDAIFLQPHKVDKLF